jgi:hypothetical protein
VIILTSTPTPLPPTSTPIVEPTQTPSGNGGNGGGGGGGGNGGNGDNDQKPTRKPTAIP